MDFSEGNREPFKIVLKGNQSMPELCLKKRKSGSSMNNLVDEEMIVDLGIN